MPFRPPFCPNLVCPLHKECEPGRIIRWGFYPRRCVRQQVQRYRCLECRKTFSYQTFRHDYCDRRPDCNAAVFGLLTSGVGLRQTARVLKIGATTAQKKMRKIAATCAKLHENLSQCLPSGRTYVMDEEESYEGASIRPLTVPIVIDKQNWFVVAASVGPIRRLARPGSKRRKRQEREERLRGKRPDHSRKCVREVLEALRRRCVGSIGLVTDQKSSYAAIARQVFGGEIVHTTVAGSAPRTTRNPLFPINSTIAMSRDNCGRLRRQSWLVSKLAKWLRAHLSLFVVYRNYVRKRFNRDGDQETPARLLGLLPRALDPVQVVGWRQDWGLRSLHPLSSAGDRHIGTASGSMTAV